MIKKNIKKLIITSVVILLPVIVGIVLWDRLPDEVATHFGINNTPDRYSSKTFAVFGMPSLILAFHWLCAFLSGLDPKMKNLSDKNFTLVLWICPAISMLVSSLTYAYALNNEVRIGIFVILFMGILFMVTGNYLPKVKQNYSLGIKLPWTLNDEENWNRTHRFAGKIWVVCGIIICLTAVTENPFVFFAVVIAGVILPTVYSYRLYKTKNK